MKNYHILHLELLNEIKAIYFILNILFISHTTAITTNPSTKIQLFTKINARLIKVLQVAEYKWQNKIPIENIEQEQNILLSAKKIAVKLGLDEDAIEQFLDSRYKLTKQFSIVILLIKCPD